MPNDYVIKDIGATFTIGNIEQFNHLLKYLALNTGSLFSVNAVSESAPDGLLLQSMLG